MKTFYFIKSRLESKANQLKSHAEYCEFCAGIGNTCRAMYRKADLLVSIANLI
jgi:hypothetical protein